MGRYIQLRDADMRVGYQGGWCLKYVQDAFKTDHPFPTALAAWNANVGGKNHPNERPPAGITVPVFFSLGYEPAGHVAIRLDDMMVASSTQAGYHPRPYFHPNIENLIAVYAPGNGGCNYLGWSEYVGGVKVVGWEEYTDQRYSEVIAFERTSELDDTLPKGETKIKLVGANGEHWWVDRIRYIDGVEQSRARVNEGVTPATPEVTLVGTYIAPVPEPPVEPPVEPPTEPPVEPEIPTPPVEPVPPVSNENNIFRQLWRIIKLLWAKLNEAISKRGKEL